MSLAVHCYGTGLGVWVGAGISSTYSSWGPPVKAGSFLAAAGFPGPTYPH